MDLYARIVLKFSDPWEIVVLRVEVIRDASTGVQNEGIFLCQFRCGIKAFRRLLIVGERVITHLLKHGWIKFHLTGLRGKASRFSPDVGLVLVVRLILSHPGEHAHLLEILPLDLGLPELIVKHLLHGLPWPELGGDSLADLKVYLQS